MSSKLLQCSQDIVIKSLSKMMIPSDAVFWFKGDCDGQGIPLLVVR